MADVVESVWCRPCQLNWSHISINGQRFDSSLTLFCIFFSLCGLQPADYVVLQYAFKVCWKVIRVVHGLQLTTLRKICGTTPLWFARHGPWFRKLFNRCRHHTWCVWLYSKNLSSFEHWLTSCILLDHEGTEMPCLKTSHDDTSMHLAILFQVTLSLNQSSDLIWSGSNRYATHMTSGQTSSMKTVTVANLWRQDTSREYCCGSRWLHIDNDYNDLSTNCPVARQSWHGRNDCIVCQP